MLSEYDMVSRYYPANPLPFEIVNKQCSICEEALFEMNKYRQYAMIGEHVEVLLHKDSAGRGWHIQGYKLGNQDYVDLSDMYNKGVNKE